LLMLSVPSVVEREFVFYVPRRWRREYERAVDANYLDQLRSQAKEFSNRLLSRKSGVAKSAITNFKKGENIKPRTLRKLTKAIHALQNQGMKD